MLIVTVGTALNVISAMRESAGESFCPKVMLLGKRIESVYKPISSQAKDEGTCVILYIEGVVCLLLKEN